MSAANCAGIRKSLLAVRVQAGRASGCFDGGGSPPRDLHELMHGRTPEFPGAHCPLPVVVCPCAVACGDVAINNSGNSFGAEAWQWHHPCRDTAVYQIAVSWQRLGSASISALGSSVHGPFRGRSCVVAKLRRLPVFPSHGVHRSGRAVDHDQRPEPLQRKPWRRTPPGACTRVLSAPRSGLDYPCYPKESGQA